MSGDDWYNSFAMYRTDLNTVSKLQVVVKCYCHVNQCFSYKDLQLILLEETKCCVQF